MKRFPPDFIWGVATSAYQIEGAASEDGRGASIWDTFARTPGKIERGETGDVACDHYHRWSEDVAHIAYLGVRAYRFSIAWPRIQPDGRGAPNAKGIEFYDRLVDALLERGISPMATLYHWDLPQALEDRGGWRSRETAQRFAEFARICFEALGDRVPMWITHNEPWCAGFLGHWHGVHAPGLNELPAALRAIHHLLLSHGLAVQAYRATGHGKQIGITLNMAPNEPQSGSEEDRAAAWASDGYANRWFLDPIYRSAYPADIVAQYERVAGPLDFIRDGDLRTMGEFTEFLGVNYYNARIVRAAPERPLGWAVVEKGPGMEVAGMGWEVMPDGLERLLLRVHEDYGGPVMYVTENGCGYEEGPDKDGVVRDERRITYLRAHLASAHEAIAKGVDLRGYFVWSLLDNFEWAFGYRVRFGIVYVDFATQQRIPKESFRFYQRLIAANGLDG